MRYASLVAVVRPGRAVLDEGAAVTAATADPELGVELLKGARTLPTQRGQGSGSERRTDETVDQQPVAGTGRLLDLMPRQPLIEQVAERTFVRAAVLSRTCWRSWSRITIAASLVSAEPLSMSCRPVTGSYPAEIRAWYVAPRWRMPVRSLGGCLVRAITAAYSAVKDSPMDKDQDL